MAGASSGMANTRSAGADDDGRPPLSFNLQTGLSLALVLVIVGAAVTYGRQSQRLDAIEQEVREGRAEMRGMRSELQSLRELLIRHAEGRRTPDS